MECSSHRQALHRKTEISERETKLARRERERERKRQSPTRWYTTYYHEPYRNYSEHHKMLQISYNKMLSIS